MQYIYHTNGDPVGYATDRYIYLIDGTPVGQLNGSHVHKLSGDYVGELEDGLVLDKYIGNPGNMGGCGYPSSPGSVGNPGNRGGGNYAYTDVFDKLLD